MYKITNVTDRQGIIKQEFINDMKSAHGDELLGYTDLRDESLPHDMYMILGMESNQWGSVFVTLYQINSGIQKTVKFGKDKKKKPVYKGDLSQGNICIIATDWFKKWRNIDGKMQQIDEYEELIISYAKIK